MSKTARNVVLALIQRGNLSIITSTPQTLPVRLSQTHINHFTHLLQTWTSLSSANSRSVSSLWCMADHLNSGMRNMVVRGPGLNWRRCSSVMGVPLKPRSTRISLSIWVARRLCTLWWETNQSLKWMNLASCIQFVVHHEILYTD